MAERPRSPRGLLPPKPYPAPTADHLVIARQARLLALTEVHEFFEFDATTEEQFDTWLHERIKEVRAQLGLASTLTERPTP